MGGGSVGGAGEIDPPEQFAAAAEEAVDSGIGIAVFMTVN